MISEEEKMETSEVMASDCDSSTYEKLFSCYPQHLKVLESTELSAKIIDSCSKKKKNAVIHCDLMFNEKEILCGLGSDTIFLLNPEKLSASLELAPSGQLKKHPGISCVRGSKTSPTIGYTSSSIDGSIKGWDFRMDGRTPISKFSIDSGKLKSSEGKTIANKEILSFDLNCHDQIICGGTELVEEDSYILFWDVRASKLLGCYSEAHSDDITAIEFHSQMPHALASGSTDGLVNVFNLLESSEDDALKYCFNTSSSVEYVNWCNAEVPVSSKMNGIVCVTHTNDIFVWNAETGDELKIFSRSAVAKAMNEKTADSVYVSKSLPSGAASFGAQILASSLLGGPARTMRISEGWRLQPEALFEGQKSIIKTAVKFSSNNRWATFDDNGFIKLWTIAGAADDDASTKFKEHREKDACKKRHKPYLKK